MKPLRLVVIIVLFSIFFSSYLAFNAKADSAAILNVSLPAGTIITSSNQAPIASFTYSPTIPTSGETIIFNASTSYDSDGWIVQYKWNFGDGNVATATSPITTYAYPIDGNYTVALTVTDNSGSTGVATAVIEVKTVVFFRVCFFGSLIPVPNVEVTAYYKKGSSWLKAPVGRYYLEILYDLMTQPDLANTYEEKYRNPGTTASILRSDASNIGFDLHQDSWTVFFKFQWGSHIAYWPNDTSKVYSYNNGVIETHNYGSYHQAYWDSTAGTYVIKVSNIPKDGVNPNEGHPVIAGILCPPPPKKYYLTVNTDPSGIATIPGGGEYVEGTNVTLTAPAYVDVSSDTRYRFNYWGVDGTSRGSGVNPITVFMNANHTATAHYILQYSVVFAQTGLSSDATGTVVTVDGSAKAFGDLPFSKWIDNGGSVSYSYGSIVSSTVSGKRFRLNSVTGSASPITVSGPATVAGNYFVQYLVTFAQTGLNSTATGTVVTVNSVAKTYNDLPYSFWTDCGSTITFSYSSIVSSTISDTRFRLNSVSGSASPITVSGPVTVTGDYFVQYLVTFAQTELDSTAMGTVVTINGVTKTYSDLPYSFWADSGSSVIVSYSYSSIVSSTVPDEQFELVAVHCPTSPFPVCGPVKISGEYCHKYLVKFAQTGLDSTATGTVVTVNGAPKTYSNLPYTIWVTKGSTVTYSYNSPVSSSTSGKRFRLNSVSGPSSPFNVTGCTTVTGNYVVQYSVTFAQTGLDSTATGTVVTVNSVAKTYGDLPYTIWVDCGGSVTYSYSSIVSSTVSGKRFRLDSVSGPSSPISVTTSKTVTGNYKTQYSVTFGQSGLDSTATGTVVTVNSVAKTYGDLSYTLWVDSGNSVTYSYSDPVLSTVSGKRFQKVSVTGPSSPITVTSSVTVTGSYKIQYQVAFDQTGVGTDFTGTVVTIDSINYGRSGLPTSPFWWDQNSNHNFAFASPLVVNASKQYSWTSTSGLSTLQSETLTITGSGSVVGNYVVGNCITFDQVGVSSDFSGTVLTVDSTPYGVSALPVSFIWQTGSVHSFAFQSPLVVNAGKQYVWTGTTGLSTLQSDSITVSTYGSIVGHYKTQYYLTLATNPSGITSPSGAGWYDANTYASISTAQYVPGGSRYCFTGWTTGDMTEIAAPSSPSTTVFMDEAKTVTANYVHQYLVTFKQNGLASDASGTVVTVNTTAKTYTDLPYSIWVNAGGTVNYLYETTVTSTTSGKRFSLTGVTGPSSPITVNADTNITGNYKIQWYLTVSSLYGTTGGQGWYDNGATAYASVTPLTVPGPTGVQYVFTQWSGDASGITSPSNPITMDGAKTATANWKTQYSVTFGQSGLDSTAIGTVVTINGGTTKDYTQLPYTMWVDNGSVVTYSYGNVSSSTAGKRFILTGVSGLASPITVTNPVTVVGNYKIQYQITFNQSGVGSDFTGTVVTVDLTGYTVGTLPVSFWWDTGSSHTFAYYSPLVVNASKQYIWTSTTGLSTLQNDTLTITGSGSVTGIYSVQGKYQITFDVTGVGGDATGTIVTIDSVSYNFVNLPVSFWWDSSSTHNFSFTSVINAGSGKRYVWSNTTGLSTLQSGSITVTGSGSVIGHYKTQYYLTLATNPSGVTSPSGAGWYDANTLATVSTAAFVDIVPGSSRYRFNGWTTADMSEITNPTTSPTTVKMDKGKTVVANYATQYSITFKQSGLDSSATGTVVTVNTVGKTLGDLPYVLWIDNSSMITYSYSSPVSSTTSGKRFVLTGVTGPSSPITVTGTATVTGNFKIQYYLTVNTHPAGLIPAPSPLGDWYDVGVTVSETASMKSYKNSVEYDFKYFDIDGTSQGSGVNPISVTMNAPHTATAHYQQSQPSPTVGGRAEFVVKVHLPVSEPSFASVLTLVILAVALILATTLSKRRSKISVMRKIL